MVCEHGITKGTLKAKIGKQDIPARLPTKINKIAVFGDTGCRMRKGGAYQPCETPQGWPLSKIAEGIANREPQLIIFTGDSFTGNMPVIQRLKLQETVQAVQAH